MKNVVIIGGCGANIFSVESALKRIAKNVNVCVSIDPNKIVAASHVILPGVGSAGSAMQRLRELGLVDIIKNIEQPLLGICLGMQLLYDFSEEENTECLGLIPGSIKKFQLEKRLTIPHMGWNQLLFPQKKSEIFNSIEEKENVFFVHSYYAPESKYTIASAEYGIKFCAAVNKDNVFACQFHPERSSKIGAKILENFITRF